MTEYWVSRKKWRCPYCDIVINDDVPSRQQHENGLRHKGAVERALKGVYKKSAAERKEKSDAEREMKRIEAAARAAMEKDGAAAIPGLGQASSSSSASAEPKASASAPKKPPTWKPSDVASAYGTVAPEFARLSEAEKAFQEEQERKRAEGTVGEWSVVDSSSDVASSRQQRVIAQASAVPSTTSSVAQQLPPSDREVARRFKLRERDAAFDDDDQENSLSEIRVKKRIKVQGKADAEEEKKLKPEWRPISIDLPDSEGEDEDEEAPDGSAPQEPVKEDDVAAEQGAGDGQGSEEIPTGEPALVVPSDAPSAVTVTEAEQAAAEPAGSLFKKRKNKGSGKKIIVV